MAQDYDPLRHTGDLVVLVPSISIFTKSTDVFFFFYGAWMHIPGVLGASEHLHMVSMDMEKNAVCWKIDPRVPVANGMFIYPNCHDIDTCCSTVVLQPGWVALAANPLRCGIFFWKSSNEPWVAQVIKLNGAFSSHGADYQSVWLLCFAAIVSKMFKEPARWTWRFQDALLRSDYIVTTQKNGVEHPDEIDHCAN